MDYTFIRNGSMRICAGAHTVATSALAGSPLRSNMGAEWLSAEDLFLERAISFGSNGLIH